MTTLQYGKRFDIITMEMLKRLRLGSVRKEGVVSNITQAQPFRRF